MHASGKPQEASDETRAHRARRVSGMNAKKSVAKKNKPIGLPGAFRGDEWVSSSSVELNASSTETVGLTLCSVDDSEPDLRETE